MILTGRSLMSGRPHMSTTRSIPRVPSTLIMLAAFVAPFATANAASVDGRDGYRYDVATAADDCGAILRTGGDGVTAVLHEFERTRDGCGPRPGLILGTDGHLYGMTLDGGPRAPGSLPAIAGGTVFRLTRDGVFTILHAFSSEDPANGWRPGIGLVEGPDSGFYGVTEHGGDGCAECGTIFRIGADGTFARLHAFTGEDGMAPSSALTVGADGRLYGITDGATTGLATLFSITTDGRFELLRSETAESGLAMTQTLATEMMATVQTFDPDNLTAALLDDFNRENSSTLGDSWIPFQQGFAESRARISDQIAWPGGDGPRGDYWSTPFDADQEAYARFSRNFGYDDIGIVIRYNPQTGSGYAALPNINGVTRISLGRIENGSIGNLLATTGSNPYDVDDESWIGIRAVGNQISVWHRKDDEPWTRLLSVTDNNFTEGGYAGFWLNNLHTLDDFHAGSLDVPPPPPPPPPPPDDDGDGGDDDDDSGDNGGNGPGNGGGATDPNVNPISGSPGGGRRGGIGLGATGLEVLAVFTLILLTRRRRPSAWHRQ